jgi:ATP-dependent Clp protease protease subunit
MDYEINRHQQKDEYRELVLNDIEYTRNPLVDGVLQITDRRIPLNGVILMSTADYVTSMIDYFNNKNPEHPIFIVIDSCPGGSVMAGYRILKSMEGSRAPVYVVVKSYAASMAATITTLAPKSYAYPNAIIHHHQMLYSSRGNMTQQKEMLKEMEEWWDRLAKPIADKMGITLQEFVTRMYQKNSDGEWTEFGTRAVELNWVDNIITEIQEVGTLRRPSEEKPPMFPWFALTEEKDPTTGMTYVQLPRLDPFDAWYLHNPDQYYRF